MFETERLILRPWIPEEDAIQAFAIYGNAEVMGFIRPPEKTIEAVRLKLKEDIERSRACNNGTGTWAVIEKANHEILGAVLLKQLPDNLRNLTQDHEIGWHFRRSSWGKGYATEAAKVILDYGFNELELPIIYAVIKPGNERSIRVTQRLGMTPMGFTSQYYGVELLLFKLTKD